MTTLAEVLATFAAGWFACVVTKALRGHALAIEALRANVYRLESGQPDLAPLRELERVVPRLETDVIFLKEEVFGDGFTGLTNTPRTSNRH